MKALKTWLVLSAVALGSLGFLLTGRAGDRTLLVPGTTSAGHYQMELACNECHTEPFASADTLSASCTRCHGAELETAENSHPKSKFTDPRNAERTQRLDARRCTTCHREHWPEGTQAMGVSVPVDNCSLCHADIARERPSHVGLEATSCSDTGCHKFHDNRSLYEEYLVEHAAEPSLGLHPVLAERAARAPVASSPRAPLTAADGDGPEDHALTPRELEAWALSAHASAGVNCRGCHEIDGAWRDRVGVEACGRCHEGERAGWVSGRHGMRVGLGLPAMRPELARATMRPSSRGRELDCSSCHGAHGFDRRVAAVEACQACHADAHSQAYSESPHARAWRAELEGEGPAGGGVSCATCHLPRLSHPSGEAYVQHNPNDNLRPREKMIRDVCQRCHGLSFSIDAMADQALIDNNFAGRPQQHVQSIDWAVAHAAAAQPASSNRSGRRK